MGMVNIIIPFPKRRASHRGACAQTQQAPQGGMQTPKQGCRKSQMRKANSDAHHQCLKCLGSGQRRQQKPSDGSWVPAEQVWDLFLQPSSVGESHRTTQRAQRSLQIPWVLLCHKQKRWQARKALVGINHHHFCKRNST